MNPDAESPEHDRFEVRDLPDGWARTTLADISETIQYGYTASGINGSTGPRFLRITDIQGGQVEWGRVPTCAITESDLIKYRLRSGDIVFARTGATTGKSYLLQPCPDAVFASYLIRLSLSPEIEPGFIARFLQTSEYWQFISENVAGNAQPNCNATKLAVLPLPLPPEPEQRRIREKLDQLFASVQFSKRGLQRIRNLISLFRQSVLSAACSGNLTSAWRSQHQFVESSRVLLSRAAARRSRAYLAAREHARSKGLRPPKVPANLDFVDVEAAGLPDIPSEWSWSYLPFLGNLNRGKSKHRPRNAPELYGGPYPFIQTGDVANAMGRISSHRQTYSRAGLAQSHLWPAKTVCITIAANIAHSAVLTYPACFPDSLVGLITDETLCVPEYAEFFIRTARTSLDQFAPATAQKNINIEILNEVAVPLPPLEEQHEIVRRVEALFKLGEAIEQRVAAASLRAERLTQAVLAKAFRGELVPTEAELARREGRTYEPASELLERIKAERAKASQNGAKRKKPKGRPGTEPRA